MLTLPADLDSVFQRLAELEDKPKTKVIVEYLSSLRPHAESMIESLDAIKNKKANPVEILQKFTAEMMIAMGDLGREMDQTINDNKIKQAKKNDG
jgi:hypothetical protein